MDCLTAYLAQLLFQSAACERQPAVIEKSTQFVVARHPDQYRGRVCNCVKELFPILNRLDSPYAICDIRESGEDETTLVGSNGVQFYFNAKLTAILSKAVKVLADRRSVGDRLRNGSD